MSFSSPFARIAKFSDETKCFFLNNEPCMVRPTLTDLNSRVLKCYSIVISLDQFNERCNVLSPRVCVPKNINVKVFNMITNNKY